MGLGVLGANIISRIIMSSMGFVLSYSAMPILLIYTALNALGANTAAVFKYMFAQRKMDKSIGDTVSFITSIDSERDYPKTEIIEATRPNEATNMSTSSDDDIITFACFAEGTRIRTADGEIKVKDLRVGQLVETMDNGLQPVRWVARRTIAGTGSNAPIVIKKHALNNTRDLYVSPYHRMMLKGWKSELLFAHSEVLVAAKYLVNGKTIYAKEISRPVEYFQILFDKHEIIYANNSLSESFHLGDEALKFFGKAEMQNLYKSFPTIFNKSKLYETKTARHCLRSYEANLLLKEKYNESIQLATERKWPISKEEISHEKPLFKKAAQSTQ